MPGGDRTGPWGLGPRTGRVGYCAGSGVPSYANPGFGRGRGRGFRRGFRGRGVYSYPAPYNTETYPEPNREKEKAYLEDMVKGLDEEIKMIRERLHELSKEKKEASQ